MKVFVGKKWRDGFLDYYRSPNEYRLKVLAFKNLEKLEDVYHVRPKSLRLLWNYFPVVGPGGMFRKTWSRIREERRNEKYVSCGIGKIIEAAEDGRFKNGDVVGFIAPLYSKTVERIVLPEQLLFYVEGSLPQFSEDAILYLPHEKANNKESNWWDSMRGWSIYSGIPITPEMQEEFRKGAQETLRNADWQKARRLATDINDKPQEIKGKLPNLKPEKKIGALFGYGNYAKINIIPYSKPYVHVKTVHEIDPTQILLESSIERWDASPVHRENENHNVYFIASYNHTHAPLAVEALSKRAIVVMEKPIATSYEQLDRLEQAIKKNNGKIFIGFQKRYSVFNDYVRKDLNIKPGDPIDYHCVVFEIIQPKFFWYNWPNSLSRLFSNGCHLVDHFLYLNEYSEPTNIELDAVDDGTVNVWIELKNGAIFTMAFSEKGSSRVGPRDHIELKTLGHNVRITDATRYFAENEKRILRKKRVWKTESYKRMYKTIGRKIVNDEQGDSLHSIITSAKTMLEIEDKLTAALRKRGKTIF